MQITKVARFTHDVKILIPIDGGHREDNLKVTYNYLGLDETKAFDLSTPEGTTAYLKAIIHSFDDLTDDKNKPVGYTAALRDQLLNAQYVRQPVMGHYLDAVRKVKPGN